MIRMTACGTLFLSSFSFTVLQTCLRRTSKFRLFTMCWTKQRVGGEFWMYARLLTAEGEVSMRPIDTDVE